MPNAADLFMTVRMPLRAGRLRRCAAMLPLVLLGACSMPGERAPELDIGEVRVQMAPDANFNSPVTLGVVLVTDRELEPRVLNPGPSWFEIDAGLASAHPAGLQAWRCEMTGGQEMVLPRSLLDGARAHAVLVVAGLGGTEHRVRIDAWRKGGLIAIGRDHWRVQPGAAAPPAGARLPVTHCKSSLRAQ